MICPTCFATYGSDTKVCAADGADLVPDEVFAGADRDLAPGDVVGEYQIEGKIGQGGFGAVFKAVHPLIGKAAAVKVLSRQFSSNPQMVSRFIAEARAVNQIRHRNIIDIFAFGRLADGRQYYVMELLEGVPFDRYIAQHGRLSLEQAAPILRGIARALDAAHGKGLLHRDLKPENVFLVFDEEGRVEPKLLDFGLVKLIADASGQHKTKTGTPMGTPYYMSPEQCRGLECDRRTDVYSFGALVFEVLTGKPPFDSESQMDILVKHMTAEPPRVSERVPELGPAFDAPIRRMMAKERDDRPGTIGEALGELLAAGGLESTRTLAMRPTLPSEAGPQSPAVARAHGTFLAAEADVVPPRRSKAKIVLAAVAMLAVGAGIVAVLAVRAAPTPIAAPANAPARASSSPEIAPVLPSSPPPVATTVSLRIDGAPPGATVTANGKTLGPAPGPFDIAKGEDLKIAIQAKGYRPREVVLSAPAADLVVPVQLDKLPLAAAPKKPGLNPELEGF